jgi:hypothetical protein
MTSYERINNWRWADMSVKKAILTKLLVFTIVFGLSNVGFPQVHEEETISFSGIIQDVSKDYRSIVVNKKSFLISKDTKIVDQKGKSLKLQDLKSSLDVALDAIYRRDGYVLKKIVVIQDRAI